MGDVAMASVYQTQARDRVGAPYRNGTLNIGVAGSFMHWC